MLNLKVKTGVLAALLCALAQVGCSGPDTVDRAFESVGAEEAYEQGIAAHRSGDLTAAETFFQHAIDLNPRYLVAYVALGLVLLHDDRPTEALALFDQAVAIRNLSGDAHAGRAEALFRLGRYEDAMPAATTAIERGNTESGRRVLGLVLESLGDIDRAIEMLEAVLQEAPERTDVRVDLTRMYLSVNRARDALPMLERGARRDTTDVVVWIALARLLHDLQIWDRATEAWQAVIRLDPGNASTLMYLGEAHLMTGNEMLAIQALTDAVDADPRLGGAYVSLAQVELQRGFLNRAARNAEQGLSLIPDDLDALVLMGAVRERQNAVADAIVSYVRAIELHPDALAPAMALGALYLGIDDAESALAVLAPHEPEANRNRDLSQLLLNAYLASGETELALTYLQRQLEDEPDDHTLILGLVQTALLAPSQTVLSTAEVLAYAERAVSLGGSYRLEYRLALIDALILDGQSRRARQEARRALEDLPNSPELTERLDSL
jgi:tetratricopeptide (TPR) repeat protein